MKFAIVVTSLFLIVSSMGCTKEEQSSTYQVMDSGAWTKDMGLNRTYWLDNERILFVSNQLFIPEGGKSVLSVWNRSAGQLESYHEIVNLICAEGEQVFFVSKDQTSDTNKYYRGLLETPIEHPQPSQGMRWDRSFDCDWTPPSSRAKVPFRIKLKDENYLEVIKNETVSWQSGLQHGEVQYYERPDLPPSILPIYVEPAGSYSVEFNRRRNAYFISPSQYYPEDSYYHSMWWLQRDGKLTKESFPRNIPWPSSGGLSIHPLVDGYLALYQGGGTRSMNNTGSRGLYLIKGETIETILLGAIHAVSVSPDGCRAAFIHAKNTKEYFSREKPYRTVKAINFCEERKK